ncbi:fluoride efflux transporter CrcB [Prevotella sp. MGM1]|nr:fluoride efflux transporter CrcB [Prevotella sp. MGM1]
MKVEKVVKPPQKPVTRNNFTDGEQIPLNDVPDNSPIKKHPSTLTVIVAKGTTGIPNIRNKTETR